MPNMIQHIVEVKGRVAFPLDMLRYDALAPYNSMDANKIEASICHSASQREIGTIVLYRWAERRWTPTYDRWKSFLWEVTKHEVRK